MLLLSMNKLLLSLTLAAGAVSSVAHAAPPNIVFIYADDLGYGDVSSYGATRVQTPNFDKVARQGLRFTDAHAAAATCTPSRYALLTGQYAFRKPGTGILPGDAALIIDPQSTTLPSMLQEAGYTTGIVGKWHLGLGDKQGGQDWNGEIKPGPNEVGFDYSFIMAATGDRVPTVYIENRRVFNLNPDDPLRVSYSEPFEGELTGGEHPELLKLQADRQHSDTIHNGVGRIGHMKGGKSALWHDESMADTFTGRAVSFLEKQKKDKPFFLYFSTHDIHAPRMPHPRFVGKTPMGARGDAIVEFDWSVGEITKTLDRLGFSKDTLLIISSDNGPVVTDGYFGDAAAKLGDHKPAGPFRGGKYGALEGGTRVPFVTRWPGHIKPGVSNALISQVDFLASFAALTGQKLDENAAPDSFDMLAPMLGQTQTGRDHFIEHAGVLSLRQGDWKYIQPSNGLKRDERGLNPKGLLYNLKTDINETNDLMKENPAKAQEMNAMLNNLRDAGRSRP